MKVYVASSWRNPRQPGIVQALRAAGHEVYDFRAHGDFHWSDIDPAWESWTPAEVVVALKHHPIAQRSFACDMKALEACDALVLVMPCGRSAHLELGYAIGAGKRTAVLLEDGEPELMWAAADWIGADLGDLIAWLEAESRTPCVVGDEELARGEAAPSEVDYATLLLGQPVPGKEAEELRQGIERLIADIAVADPEDIAADLQRLLDETDARDALAYLEGQAPCSNCGRIGEHDETCPVPRELEAAAIYHATRPTTTELLRRLRPGDTFLLKCKAAVGSAPMLAKAVLRHEEEPTCPLVDTNADPDVAARSVLIQLPRRT